jgi:hypothetical protein
MVQKEREGGIREVMSILTIRKAFPDEWVATEVKRVDKADVPIAGRVLLHSPEKNVVYQSMQTYLAPGCFSSSLEILFRMMWRLRLPAASRIRGRLAHGSVLLVPVRVQGQDFEFLVDTGAAYTALSPEIVPYLA